MRCKLRRHVPSILIGIANLHHFPATISHWCSKRYRVASALRQTYRHRRQQNICNFARKTNHVPRTADDAKNMRQLFSCTFKNIHFHRWRSISRRGGALYLTIGRPTGHGCKVNVTVEGKVLQSAIFWTFYFITIVFRKYLLTLLYEHTEN